MNLAILTISVLFLAVRHSGGQLVNTNSGKLLGRTEYSRGGQAYYSFKGIPYAEKPERFQLAQPVKPWNGTRDAGDFGQVCVQPLLGGSEDCLYLNVFTLAESRCQNESSNGKLPVLVHIHGGSFEALGGDVYGPNFFMDECVLYVSMNYRLGALGFLTTGDGVIPGNLGLKDSVLALKWINENIGFFRGDNGSITLTGQSSGAGTVSLFIVSAATSGLFQKVIALSGSSLGQWAISKNPREDAFKLGQLLNCTGNSSQELLECLTERPGQQIVETQAQVMSWLYSWPAFVPVVEPEYAIQPFLTEDPYQRYVRGDVSRVPLMTGTMRDEAISPAGSILRDSVATEELDTKWNAVAPLLYLYDFLNVSTNARDNISQRIRQYYFGDNPVGNETFNGIMNSITDSAFVFGSYEESVLLCKYAPVYNYVNAFEGDYSFGSAGLGLNYTVASHGDDMIYLFDMALAPPPLPGTRAFEFSERLIKLFVSFMKNGKPDPVGDNALEWPTFTEETPKSMKLDLPFELVPDFKADAIQFWKSLKIRELQFPSSSGQQY